MDGTQIGTYRIERKLGEGGMGVVYIGMDVRLGRRAAIKQLLPEMSGQREIVERFFNEAKAAASINHPGIVEIYDVGWHSDGSAFFAMKLLEGDSLAKRVRLHGPMPPALAASIARQVGSALAAAHARGIVHRDLKPDNVIMVADEEVAIGERAVILDFGIAKLFGDGPMTHKTRTGSVMGTPYYMSPEQCRGAGEVDHRTDIYALGCILFELLTGRPPFVAEGAGEILGMHQFVEPPTVRSLRPDVSPELEAVVSGLLAKAPDRRPQSMTEVGGLLQPFTMRAVHSGEMAAQRPSTAGAVASPVQSAPPQASTFSRARGEVAAATPTAPGNRRGMFAVAAGIAVVAAAVVAIVIATGGGGSSPSTSASGGGVVSAGAIDAADVLEGQGTATASSAEPAPIVDASVPVVDEQAIAERTRADATAQIRYEDFVQAMQRKDHLGAQAAFAKIPADSTYRAQAQPQLDQLRSEFIAQSRMQAEKLARLGKCKDIGRAAVTAGKVYPEAGDAMKQVSCEARTASGGDQVASAKPDEDRSTDDKIGGKTVSQLVDEANDAARSGMYGKSLALAEAALKQEPGNQIVLTSAAIAACNLKSADRAKKYINRLSGQRQGMARQICLRNNVTVD